MLFIHILDEIDRLIYRKKYYREDVTIEQLENLKYFVKELEKFTIEDFEICEMKNFDAGFKLGKEQVR